MRKSLYLLRGKEDFLKELFIWKEQQKYIDFLTIDGSSVTLKEFISLVSDVGVFDTNSSKMVIVKNAEMFPLKSKEEVSLLLNCLSGRVALFFVFEDDNRSSRVCNLLKGLAREVVFGRLYGDRLQRWVKSLLTEFGVKSYPELVSRLASLEKLPLIYDKVQQISLLSQDGNVDESDVEKIFAGIDTINPFAVIDAILNRDVSLLMGVVYHSRTREEALKAFYTVVKYIHTLFVARLLAERKNGSSVEDGLVSLLKLHPFVAKKVARALSLYPLDFFRKKIPYLYHVEVRLRKSHLELKDSISKGLFYLFSDAN
ncbi:MAG: hypothetical protein J7L41_02385 [Synergistetes bacterium]|nr:hypothetical protein [Synergistota bacterium]